MDDKFMDHYEKQLYTVFKTFDVGNEEALDKSAVLDLCNALQLEDRGSVLVDSLFEKNTDRVTFAQFRNGLLSVLGNSGVEAANSTTAEPSPVVPTTTLSQTCHSDDDSSGREVAPKFVYGSKKYGRRSRPQRSAASSRDLPSPRASSDSRIENDSKRLRQQRQCKRSASVMENRGVEAVVTNNFFTENLDHDKQIDCEHALALCKSLHMDGIDTSIVEKIFEELPSKETTIGEFFDRLNLSLASSIADVCKNEVEESNTSQLDDNIASEVVIEAWEHAGIQQARLLLSDLGFKMTHLQASSLEKALEDELSSLTIPCNQPTAMLLIAALALSHIQIQRTRQEIRVTLAERDKLRADLFEANKRAQILAQDVDENQARIEAELKSGLKMLEIRHAEVQRTNATERIEERERAAAVRSHLEAELFKKNETEIRLRAEIQMLSDRYKELEQRANNAEEHVKISERNLVHVSSQIGENHHIQVENLEDIRAKFLIQIDELKIENKQLRDRNDELCAELEGYTRHADTGALVPLNMSAASWREEAALVQAVHESDSSIEPSSLISHSRAEECDSSLVSIDYKSYGHIEIIRRLQALLDTIQVSPKAEACETCMLVKGTLSMFQEKTEELANPNITAERNGVKHNELVDSSSQTESPDPNHGPIDENAKTMSELELRHMEEKQKLSNLVKDLETSLDQLKLEYYKCEDYWQGKLDEERELYNEEQKASDERLADLIGKIGEYERQFAGGRLPTIDEAREFETQVNKYEEELLNYKKEKESELEKKTAEIAELRKRLEENLARPATNCSCMGAGGERHAVRDYHNPAFAPPSRTPVQPTTPSCPENGNGRPASQNDAEVQNTIQKGESVAGSGCTCAALSARCRLLWARGEAWRAAGAREAGELRARLAAAETAVARLHARLASADLLVKDLYLENCQLAHTAPRRTL